MTFIPFPSIVGFHNVVRFADAFPEAMSGPVCYRGKIKLHGTNCGITIHNGNIETQSRSVIITPIDDHMGFAKWVAANVYYWRTIPDGLPKTEGVPQPPITVFGEWCGQGVQDTCAISQIGKKVFAVFAIFVNDHETIAESTLITDPNAIGRILGNSGLPPDTYVIPWYGDSISVDYKDKNTLQATADVLDKMVQEIEPCDPWVKQTFGVEGCGEGIVFYPGAGTAMTMKRYEELAFKAKGEKHRVAKAKAPVQIAPEVAASVDAFVAMFVTEPRLEQGLAASGGVATMKNIGAFLKWMAADIYKESEDELEASKLEWDTVAKSVQAASKAWFIAKSKVI